MQIKGGNEGWWKGVGGVIMQWGTDSEGLRGVMQTDDAEEV